jgi:hypothetical protein
MFRFAGLSLKEIKFEDGEMQKAMARLTLNVHKSEYGAVVWFTEEDNIISKHFSRLSKITKFADVTFNYAK